MEHFSCKVGVAYEGICLLTHSNEELACATYKQLQIIMQLTKHCAGMELKHRAVLSFQNIVCVAKWSLVMYSY